MLCFERQKVRLNGNGTPQQKVELVGINTSNQLGADQFASSTFESANSESKTPHTAALHRYVLPAGTRLRSLALGRQHTLALIDGQDGEASLWAAGSNHFGQALQREHHHRLPWTAVALPPSLGAVDCQAGFDHSVLIARDGSVWTAGWSADGQAGQGTETNVMQLGRVAIPEPILRVFTGADHTLAVSADGRRVYAWGNSEYGQCATGRKEDKILRPVRVLEHEDKPVAQVATAATSTMFALTAASGESRWRYFGFDQPEGCDVEPPGVDDGTQGLQLVSAQHHYLTAHSKTDVFAGRTKWERVFRVPDPARETIRHVACGNDFTVVVTEREAEAWVRLLRVRLRHLFLNASTHSTSPFVRITIGDTSFTTFVRDEPDEKTAAGRAWYWDDKFDFSISYHSQLFSSIQLDVMDERVFIPDLHVGRAECRISSLSSFKTKLRLPIFHHRDAPSRRPFSHGAHRHGPSLLASANSTGVDVSTDASSTVFSPKTPVPLGFIETIVLYQPQSLDAIAYDNTIESLLSPHDVPNVGAAFLEGALRVVALSKTTRNTLGSVYRLLTVFGQGVDTVSPLEW
ncbi:Williams-Beuren syndrome chromosome region 16 protein, partial [Allomyces javanicus]